MIFDCPRCEAENAVPASEIPEQGKVVTCLGCHQPFRVLPPDSDDGGDDDDGPDEDETAAIEVGESTAVSPVPMPPPLDDEKTTGAGQDLLVTRRIEPETTGSIPMPDAPLTETRSLAIPDATLGPDEAKGLGRRGRPRESRPPQQSLVPRTISARSPSESGPPLVTEARPQAAPPPARVAGPVHRARAPAGVAALLDQIPLAAKVGLAVFPIALLVIVVLRAGGATSAPKAIEIATAADQERQVAPTSIEAGQARHHDEGRERGEAEVAPPIPEAPAPSSAAPAGGLAADAPAPPGHGYISGADVKLRSQAAPGGDVVARLRAGTRVRRFEATNAFMLVMVGDRGPAGFVPIESLSERLPIEVLASQRAFQRCTVGDTDDESACATAARAEEDVCQNGCRVDPGPAGVSAEDLDLLRERCRQACTVAAARCVRTCQARLDEAEPRLAKKRRRPAQPLPGY
ncbi:MAG: hypothetical protein IT384_08520 [Deltaproteobacteria bacterium]|nr:hypothetical protein [Deltaproteobacteria bacterium]